MAAWRKRAKLTQVEMSEIVGMSRGQYSGIEKDRNSPTVRTLLRVIAAVEERDGPLGPTEDRKIARFFLGPSVEVRDAVMVDEGRTK